MSKNMCIDTFLTQNCPRHGKDFSEPAQQVISQIAGKKTVTAGKKAHTNIIRHFKLPASILRIWIQIEGNTQE
jgi:hypothetical protein